MIPREAIPPSEYSYPVDDWCLVEASFQHENVPQMETLFALSNGYLGLRGTFDEGDPAFLNGTYINAFYESWDIVYGEDAFGFAKTGQTMLNVTDGKIIRLYVDDEPLYLPTANLLRFERRLDMKHGTLTRDLVWEMPSGKQVAVRSTRLVSFTHRHLAAIAYEVTLLNAHAPVAIASDLIGNQGNQASSGDPRQSRGFTGRVLEPRLHEAEDLRLLLGHRTANSRMTVACGADHVFETECAAISETSCTEDEGRVLFSVEAEPEKPIRLVKYLAYHTSRRSPAEELGERAKRTLSRAVEQGFEELTNQQTRYLEDFWSRSDVEVQGAHRRGQQCLRWNIFQLGQASGRAEGAGVPAKGLTGQAYDGHYFWDTEIYVLPFLVYTAPRIARNLLKFRYSMLEKARKRAREVNQKGALFPWRTINGEEASAYYAAGTAQYHINADIMYALRKYVEATGDRELLYREGAEMLVETARLWRDLGFFSKRHKGRFCINEVTGPDEYNTVVDNNTYTNLMARENLWYAAATLEALQKEDPEGFALLVRKTHVSLSEVEEWKQAADNMYLPYDADLGIHPQDDEFLNKKPWDLKATPKEKYPLLLNYHPLVIYRHQVIKQADIVLALFLLGDEFTREEKKSNFDYYDPLTTGDSSLSACIQSIVAQELDYTETAVEYFRYAVLMDLADIAGNVRDGVHVASTGGTWMAMAYGFAGMRDYDGQLSFRPRLPGDTQHLKFRLVVRGQRLEVDINRDSTTYTLLEGTRLTLRHEKEDIELTKEAPRKVCACRPAAGGKVGESD